MEGIVYFARIVLNDNGTLTLKQQIDKFGVTIEDAEKKFKYLDFLSYINIGGDYKEELKYAKKSSVCDELVCTDEIVKQLNSRILYIKKNKVIDTNPKFKEKEFGNLFDNEFFHGNFSKVKVATSKSQYKIVKDKEPEIIKFILKKKDNKVYVLNSNSNENCLISEELVEQLKCKENDVLDIEVDGEDFNILAINELPIKRYLINLLIRQIKEERLPYSLLIEMTKVIKGTQSEDEIFRKLKELIESNRE